MDDSGGWSMEGRNILQDEQLAAFAFSGKDQPEGLWRNQEGNKSPHE